MFSGSRVRSRLRASTSSCPCLTHSSARSMSRTTGRILDLRISLAKRWQQKSALGATVSRSKMRATLRVMPNALGLLPADENAYERNNRWMLESAARFGDNKIAFISLWNGHGGDGPGGAHHFMADVRRKTARIYWLDTRKLWD